VDRVLEGNVELEGKRVRLIPMSLDHLEGLFEASKHCEIWTYSPGNINKPEDVLNTISHALESKEQGLRYPFVILDKDTNKIVGSTSYLEISPQHRKLEIGGTWLDPI
jgi:N-acetyltransferase